MARKLGKTGKKTSFQIKEAKPKRSPIDIEKNHITAKETGVSISLKYFRQEAECFSAWKSLELKKFSAIIQKISSRSAQELKSYKPLCKMHKNAPAKRRFARPDTLSEDLDFYEIVVDAANKARIHGVFVGSIFFLVWLDRGHAVFPEK